MPNDERTLHLELPVGADGLVRLIHKLRTQGLTLELTKRPDGRPAMNLRRLTNRDRAAMDLTSELLIEGDRTATVLTIRLPENLA